MSKEKRTPEPVRTDDGWKVDFRLPGNRNKRFIRHFPGRDSKHLAEEFIREILTKDARGPERKDVLSSAIHDYINWQEKIAGRAPATVRRDRGRLRIFNEWAIKNRIRSANDITFNHVVAFQKYFFDNAPFDRGRVLKRYKALNIPSNWEHYRQTLSAFLNWCIKRDLASKNPAADREFKIKLQKKIPPHFDPGELEKIFAYFDSRDANQPIPYFSVLFRLLAYTGMRLGEARNLKWDDINWDRGYINITKSKNKGVRVIPLHKKLKFWLKKLPMETELLFDNGGGQRLYSESWVLRQLVEACTMLRIKRRRIHDLRHSFAASLARQRVSLPEIQRLLGHQAITSTMIYVVFYPDELRNAINALEY